MAVSISCPSCFSSFSVPDRFLGKRIRCRTCGGAISVVDDEFGPEPTAPPTRRAASPPPRRDAARTPGGTSNKPLLYGGVAGGAVLLLAGVLLGSRLGGAPPAPALPPVAVVANDSTPADRSVPTAGGAEDMSRVTPPAAQMHAAAETASVSTTEFANPPAIPNAITESAPGGTGAPSAADATGGSGDPQLASITETLPAGTSSGSNPPIAGNPLLGNATSENASPINAAPINTAATSGSPAAEPVAEPAADALRAPMELVDLIEAVEPAVVRLNVTGPGGFSLGSGYVVDRDGTTVTNYHVIAESTKVEAEFADGRKVKVLGYSHADPKCDIAIIRLELPEGVPTLPVLKDLPRKGESVVGFGSPRGLSFTASEGIISAIRPAQEMRDGQGLDLQGTWLQTTTPISPGSSGGPLVDRRGRVVGMNSMTYTEGQNLNFAISAADISAALANASKTLKPFDPEQLPEHGTMLDRRKASDEIGTLRGNGLLTKVDEIFLLNVAWKGDYDPTGRMWNLVITHSKLSVEKTGVKLSFGKPAPDAAVMVVFMDLAPLRNGGAGAHEMILRADLLVIDRSVHGGQVCKVWSGKESVGTVSLQSLAGGYLPNRLDAGVRKFFTQFRTAYSAAARSQSDPSAEADPPQNN